MAEADGNAVAPRCELVSSGIEYRAYLPDHRRYVFVSVKVMTGATPSVFVIADKNYDSSKEKVAPDNPLVIWWLDRSRPMVFSTDKVKIAWDGGGTLTSLTSWISTPDPSEITAPMRGVEKRDGRFEGTGTGDANSYAFQTRIEMPNFDEDAFDVTLPSVTYDGVTVTPPVVRFERDEENEKIFVPKC